MPFIKSYTQLNDVLHYSYNLRLIGFTWWGWWCGGSFHTVESLHNSDGSRGCSEILPIPPTLTTSDCTCVYAMRLFYAALFYLLDMSHFGNMITPTHFTLSRFHHAFDTFRISLSLCLHVRDTRGWLSREG